MLLEACCNLVFKLYFIAWWRKRAAPASESNWSRSRCRLGEVTSPSMDRRHPRRPGLGSPARGATRGTHVFGAVREWTFSGHYRASVGYSGDMPGRTWGIADPARRRVGALAYRVSAWADGSAESDPPTPPGQLRTCPATSRDFHWRGQNVNDGSPPLSVSCPVALPLLHPDRLPAAGTPVETGRASAPARPTPSPRRATLLRSPPGLRGYLVYPPHRHPVASDPSLPRTEEHPP